MGHLSGGEWVVVVIIPALFIVVLIYFGIHFYDNWIKKKRNKDK